MKIGLASSILGIVGPCQGHCRPSNIFLICRNTNYKVIFFGSTQEADSKNICSSDNNNIHSLCIESCLNDFINS